MNMENNLANVNTNISGALFRIKQAKNILPISSLMTLYFALIEPHLSYGILAWGNANTKNLHKTEMLQKEQLELKLMLNIEVTQIHSSENHK